MDAVLISVYTEGWVHSTIMHLSLWAVITFIRPSSPKSSTKYDDVKWDE